MKPETLRKIFSIVEDALEDELEADPDAVEPQLGDHVLNPDLRPSPPYRRAAVLVPVVARPDGLKIIFTRRTTKLSSHAGQISLPGGSLEPGDKTVVDTALRETEEEIGLDRSRVEVLGRLDRYLTRTGFDVTPVVGLVEEPVELTLNEDEVAEVFEVPLEHFLDHAQCKTHSREFMGKPREFHVFEHNQRYIWGATAGMLVNLRDAIEAHFKPANAKNDAQKARHKKHKPKNGSQPPGTP